MNGAVIQLRKRFTGVVLALLLAIAMMSVPSAAFAAPTGKVMARTQQMSAATLSSTLLGWWNPGTTLTLVCYQRGQSVTGYYSPWIPGRYDNLWYRTDSGRWVADVDISTGTNNTVTPACTTAPKPAATTLNQRIVKAANTVRDGTYGGQCAIWAERMISSGGGPNIALGSYPSQYQQSWARYATQVSFANAKPGDIIQWQWGNNVHTAILMSGTSAGSAQVADSNFNWTPTVKRGSFSSRNSYAPIKDSYKIWRVKG